MKINKLVILCSMILLLFLTGCAGGKKEKPTLYVYNWTYYLPEEIITSFEKKFNVKVVYDVFSSNEEMFAKLKAGGKGYDLTFPSGDFTKIMIKEGMLAPIDKTLIPNFKYIDGRMIAKIKFDEGNKFSVPYMVGTAGIAVNKNKVKDYEHSSSIFGRSDLKNKMTLLDDMREVIGLALKNLGYSVNSTTDEELAKAKDLVLLWKKNVLKFDSESFGKGFASDEFLVVQGYAENVFLELDEAQKSKVDFFVPKEGGPMYMDSIVILKDSKNIELAHQFINYILEPENFAKIVDFLGLPSINTGTKKFTTTTPNYQIEDLANCEFKEDLGEAVEKYNKIWEQIRI